MVVGTAISDVVLAGFVQISELYSQLLPLAPLQTQITSSLDSVEAQQKDLSDVLDSYESQMDGLVDQSAGGASAGGGAGAWRGADAGRAEKEREKAYQLASALTGSLDNTSASLSSLIDTLNSLSPGGASTDGSNGGSGGNGADADPLAQIATILNAHLASLQYIEGSTGALRRSVHDLESRVGEVSRRMGSGSTPGSASGTPVGGGTPAQLQRGPLTTSMLSSPQRGFGGGTPSRSTRFQ